MPIINRVKYACEPCMRGHRSSKCTHEDRLLVKVRKPGRPLTSCPHIPAGTTTFVNSTGARLDASTADHGATPCGCGCEVTSLAIPKISACACGQPHSSQSVDSTSGRISKNSKKRKSISVTGEAILDLVAKQQSIDTTTVPERDRVRISEISVGESLAHPGHTTTDEARGSSEHVGPYDGDSQVQDNGLPTAQDPHNSLYNVESNPDLWGEVSWRASEAVSSHGQHGSQVQAGTHTGLFTSQIQKSCCNGNAARTASISSTASPNVMMMNQAQFQNPMPFGFHQNPAFPMFQESLQHMKPIATTIYTYPNGYTTINNPLTPQELAMLQSTETWPPAVSAAWSGLGMGATGIGAEYACSCGPTCECLGCAAHPFNSSTVNFVKDMRTMMRGHPGGQNIRKPLPTQPETGSATIRASGGCCGGEGIQQMNALHSPTPHTHSHSHIPTISQTMHYTGLPKHLIDHLSSPHPHQQPQAPQLHGIRNTGSPQSHGSPPTTGCSQIPPPQVRPHHCRPAFPPSIASPAYTSCSSPDATNAEDDTEIEQRAVSPSAYFHIDYPLGFCAGSDIGYLCGDDCTCTGCIIHGNAPPSVEGAFNESTQTETDSSQKNIGRIGSTRGGCCGGRGPSGRAENISNDQQSCDLSQEGSAQNGQQHEHNPKLSQEHELPPHHVVAHLHPLETVDGQPIFAWG